MSFHRTLPNPSNPAGPGTPPIPGTPASPESPQVPEAPKSNFDIQKALDTAGFAEFVVKCSERAGVTSGEESPEDLEKHFEIFEIKNKVASGIKKIYAGEVGSEIGVKINPKELEAVDAEIERQALEDPEAVKNMWADIQDYDDMPRQIAEKQKELDGLAVSSGYTDATMALKQEMGVIEDGKAGASGWGKIKMYAGAIIGFEKSRDLWRDTREILYRGIPLTTRGIRERLAEIAEEEARLEAKLGADKKAKQDEIDGMVSDLADVKKELFAYAGLREIITEVSRKKLTEQIWGKRGEKGANIKENDEALLRLYEFSEVEAPTTGLVYFNEPETDNFESALSENIKNSVLGKIADTLRGIKLGSGGQFSRLEKDFDDILKAETIGVMSKEETKEFLVSSLERAIDVIPNASERKQKAVLLAPIIQKLRDKKV